MKNKVNIVLTGVGGHGVITAANILGKAAINANVNIYASEIHGMAQRGGSVICTVRLGDVSSPLVSSGKADAIISTEPIEALRYINYANKFTKVVTDINAVIPYTASVGGEKYPDLLEVFTELESKVKLHKINALQIAIDSGAIITKNIVLLGALSALDILPFDYNILLNTIIDNVPKKYKLINEKAFKGGMEAIKSL